MRLVYQSKTYTIFLLYQETCTFLSPQAYTLTPNQYNDSTIANIYGISQYNKGIHTIFITAILKT